MSNDNGATSVPSEREPAKTAISEALNHTESDPPRAREIVASIADLRDSRGKEVGLAWGELVEAWIDIKRGAHAEALDHCEKARAIFEDSDDERGHSRTLNAIGVVLMYVNRFDDSLKTFRQALAVSERIGATDYASSNCVNIGILLLETGEWDEAARYFEAGEAFGIPNFNNLAVFDVKYATALLELGRLDDARARLDKAIGICADHGFHITEADALGVYGRLEERAGNADAAKERYVLATEIAVAAGNGRVEAEHRVRLADLLARVGDTDAAIAEYGRAAEAARRSGARNHLAKALDALSGLEAARGEWKTAWERSREARDAEREMYSAEFATQSALIRQERAQAEGEAYKETWERLSRVSEIGRAIASAIDVEGVGKSLHEGLATMMEFDSFALAVADAERRTLAFRYAVDNGERTEAFSVPFSNEDSLSVIAMKRGAEIVMNDAVVEMSRYVARPLAHGAPGDPDEVRSLIFHPIAMKGEPFALITVQSRREGAFTALDGEIVRSLATYAGAALENARLFEEITLMAGTDPLTGLMNRRKFFEDLAKEVTRGHRYCGMMSIVMIDLDHFKLVNDTHGHATGDLVLKETADVLRRELRSVDKSARLGGEEFVVLLPCTGLEGALIVANRLRVALASTAVLAADTGEPVRFTGSFGVSAARKEEADFDPVIARADKALYAAKDAGRNRVESLK